MPGPEQMPSASAPTLAPSAEIGSMNRPAAETGANAPRNDLESGAKNPERFSVETGEEREPQKEPTPEESLVATQEEIRRTEEKLSDIESANEKAEAKFEEVQKELGVKGGQRSEAAREVPRKKNLEEVHVLLVRQEVIYKKQLEKQRQTAEQILEKKIGELFLEFGALDPKELESLAVSGKMTDKELFKSHIFGVLQPETAKQMVEAYKKGLDKEGTRDLIIALETANVMIY